MKHIKWFFIGIATMGQTLETLPTLAAPAAEAKCMKQEFLLVAESLTGLANESGGRLLALLQCERSNPAVDTHAFIIGPGVVPVLGEGLNLVKWLTKDLILAEKVLPKSMPRLEFEFVGVAPPWVSDVPMVGMEPMRRVSPGDGGSKIGAVVRDQSGASSIAVFRREGLAVSRGLIPVPSKLSYNTIGSVVLDKLSKKLAFSLMISKDQRLVHYSFLMDSDHVEAVPVEIGESRPLFFAGDALFVIDGTGALVGCDKKSGKCSHYFAVPKEKAIMAGVAVGDGKAAILIRNLKPGNFDIRPDEIVLLDLVGKKQLSSVVLPQGKFILGLDWIRSEK